MNVRMMASSSLVKRAFWWERRMERGREKSVVVGWWSAIDEVGVGVEDEGDEW